MNTEDFFREYIDCAVPNLGTIEQSIYLYIIRHTYMEGKTDIHISISNAAKNNIFGLSGQGGTMGISSTRDKVYTLQEKGFVRVIDSTPTGLRLQAILPSDIPSIKKNELCVRAFNPT